MPPTHATDESAREEEIRADKLRSRMFADAEFMAGIRQGWEDGLQGLGITVEEYIRTRNLQ